MIHRGAALGALLLAAGCAWSLTGDTKMKSNIFVAVEGSDANPGTQDRPFATMAKARDAVRELKKGGLDRDLTVVIRGGTYRLREPLVFGPEDSGTRECSITYAAAPGEKPVLSGGRLITGWSKGDGNLWTVELPEVRAGKWYFRQLFVNGRRAVRARGPNEGFFRVVQAGPDNRTGFTFKKGDLRAFGNPEAAEIVFLHDWMISRVPIAAIDEADDTVRVANPIGLTAKDFTLGPITGFEPNPRYYVENALELLDAPGEWYLERKSGVLHYWPMAGEDLAGAETVAPVLDRLVSVKGDAAGSRSVENLRFSGLAFSHAEFPLPEQGYAEMQAGFHEERPNPDGKWQIRPPSPAVVLSAVSGCALEACEVSHVGGAGIGIEGRSEGNRIVGCHVHDVGGNGIMIGSIVNRPESLAKGNVVSDSYIHRCGATLHGSVGIWVGLTEKTLVARNEICDLPYTGVSVGWSWNTNPTQCQKNVVEFNHIHHVMQMLSDGGGIYTLGRQPGTILRGNDIHDIPLNAGRAQSNGIFMDEGSSEMLVEGNAFRGIAKSPIRLHKAERQTIRGNLLVISPGSADFTFNACSPNSMTFESNAVVRSDGSAWLQTVEQGRVGRALLCSEAAMDVPHSPSFEPAEITVEAWVRMDSYPAGKNPRRWIVNKNGSELTDGHYALIVSDRETGACLNIGGGETNAHRVVSTSAPLKLGQWQHLAMTYDGQALKLYVDGALEGTEAVSKPRRPGNTPLRIGGRQDRQTPEYFGGSIDEVRLYGRALSAEEIQAHFAAPEKVGADKALAGHWGFDDMKDVSPDCREKAREQTGPRPPWSERLLGEKGPARVRPVMGNETRQKGTAP